MKKVLAIFFICFLTIQTIRAYAATTKSHHQHAKHQLSKQGKKNTPANTTRKKGQPNAHDLKLDAANIISASLLSGISGSFDLTSNYIFRGISQTQDNPAAQGGLTYTSPIGIYAILAGSNVHFNDPIGYTATVEIDTVLGWKHKIRDHLDIDLNLNRYNYPGASNANYNEIDGLLTYRFFTLGIGYSGNVYGYHGRGLYTNGTVSIDIPTKYSLGLRDINLQAEFGHYALAKIVGNSYNDWSLGLSKKLNQTYLATIQYTDTNHNSLQPPYDRAHLVATITAIF